MRDADLTSKDLARLAATTDLMDREWAPCRYACPVHADVRGYLEAIAEGRWREAIDIIRERLPLASVCGRICHHPCEVNCRRTDVDQPVAIREVKRFVAELQAVGGSTVHKAAVQDKARVAIVGAGPSGLSAALELAKRGYRPTVFEKFPVAGGIPATAIPKYRLPRDVLRIDTDWVLAHGVELVTGVEIGQSKSLDALRQEGFAAVILATGLSTSRLLPMPGADHPRVLPALRFLTDVAFDRKVDIGQDVLVIGGGNVAVDAARSALRLGAGRVRMMFLESLDEMPAYKWEQNEALEEGITFTPRRGPTEVLVTGGRIVGVKARAVTRVFDENKRFDPRYDDADVITMDCDTVILAIGQAADMGFLQGSSLKTDARGRVPWTPATQQTNLPWVFACGEIVTPPGSVVEACASGRRVAEAVDLFLSGREIGLDDTVPPHIDKITASVAEKVVKAPREPVATEPPEERKTSFAAVDRNLAAEAAAREARRCMSCGAGAEVIVDKCAACLTCLRVCPFEIPKVTDVARIDSLLCQSCGICIAECPANAIVARGWNAKGLLPRAEAALAALPGDRKTLAYIGGYRAAPADWCGESDAVPAVAEVYLPSVARLSVLDLLAPFEKGAQGVLVVACPDGADRYPQSTQRIRRRVAQARQLLAEAGLAADRLQLLEVANQGRPAIREALAAAAQQVAVSQENAR
jgi:NADPH-dependent glutamate synthase beta subunit-like oxidoreductase/coenzyme F420-reducing hydrogenase delta subunit/Pyruvate/2-oxoacid:ferredoxin oxidoreductase delta subunit